MAAWLLSARFDGSGKWLLSGFGQHRGYPPFMFRSGEFKEALRLRLLITPIPVGSSIGVDNTCVCSDRPSLDSELLHCIDCKNLSWFKQQRHDAVRNCIAACLKKTFMCNVSLEQCIGLEPDPPCRMDIMAYVGDRTHYLDVAICNPGGKDYRTNHHASVTAGAAAGVMETRKLHHYNSLQSFQFRHDIVPFVLEATGRPSDHTRNFLKSVFAGEAFGRVANRLLARIGLIIITL